jgi:hypothetical protein
MFDDIITIIIELGWRPAALGWSHNLTGARTVVTTGRRVWPADTVTDRMGQECHKE